MRWVSDSCTAMAQAPAQLGQAHQEQAQAALGVHGVVGQQPQVLEHVVAQVLGLVDDEHGVDLGLQGQARDLGVDGAVGAARLRSTGRPSCQAMALYMSITLPVDSGT